MATPFSIPAWRIPWTEEPGRLQSMGSQELDTIEQRTLSCVSKDFFACVLNLNLGLYSEEQLQLFLKKSNK